MIDYYDLPEEAWEEEWLCRQEKKYQAALMAHPDPRDPDHPTREEFGLEED